MKKKKAPVFSFPVPFGTKVLVEEWNKAGTLREFDADWAPYNWVRYDPSMGCSTGAPCEVVSVDGNKLVLKFVVNGMPEHAFSKSGTIVKYLNGKK